MRNFTRIFKHLLGLGFEPESFIKSMWLTVRVAAEAGSHTPQTRDAIAFIDRLVGTVAGLPKPKPGDEDEEAEPKPAETETKT